MTGLTRSTMNELVLASAANGYRPPVVSVVLKKRYATRGIRLINRDSLITYLASLAPKAADAKPDKNEEGLLEVRGDDGNLGVSRCAEGVA